LAFTPAFACTVNNESGAFEIKTEPALHTAIGITLIVSSFRAPAIITVGYNNPIVGIYCTHLQLLHVPPAAVTWGANIGSLCLGALNTSKLQNPVTKSDSQNELGAFYYFIKQKELPSCTLQSRQCKVEEHFAEQIATKPVFPYSLQLIYFL
jgi:hypothetical protein